MTKLTHCSISQCGLNNRFACSRQCHRPVHTLKASPLIQSLEPGKSLYLIQGTSFHCPGAGKGDKGGEGSVVCTCVCMLVAYSLATKGYGGGGTAQTKVFIIQAA